MDCSMFVVEGLLYGQSKWVPPFQWLGKKVKAIKQWVGLILIILGICRNVAQRTWIF